MSGGGAERQLAYLAEALESSGWEVHVALTRRGPNWPRLEASGATIHEIKAAGAYDPRLFLQMRRLIRAVQPDLIQAWLLQMEVVAGLSALATGTPWIFSERASAQAYPRSAKILLRDQVARFANAIVSNSTAGDYYWRSRVGDLPTRFVVPNAVPLGEIAAVSRYQGNEVRDRTDARTILFAGRFEAQKNLFTLLPALVKVLARQRGRALFCGEGPQRASMDTWIASAGLHDRIDVTGYTPHLWSLMKSASVFVSPSLFEGSPNVVLEAMACGVPLVVSDIPEHRELLDEQSAILVPPRAIDQLAAGIESVLEDPAGAAARARAAKARVECYSPSVIARQYNDIYRSVLSTRSAR